MTPAEIIEQATADGVNLALSPAGTLTATGDQAAVDKWLWVLVRVENYPENIASAR